MTPAETLFRSPVLRTDEEARNNVRSACTTATASLAQARRSGHPRGVRRRNSLALIAVLLSPACGHPASGVVDGRFSLPGRPSADLQRGGLNFSTNDQHGKGHGHTVRVSADGTYSVTLPPGAYSALGGLSGSPGGPVAETCDATINVVVTANSTTSADYVCRATPVTSPAP